MVDIEGSVSLPELVEAFYTTRLFKLERALLKLFASRPSTDLDAKQLAVGDRSEFGAWRVEERNANQLLLTDVVGRTRSWFMTVPIGSIDGSARTRMYFGSAVVTKVDRKTGERSLGFAFKALLGFHKLYSRALLRAAWSRLVQLQTRRASQEGM